MPDDQGYAFASHLVGYGHGLFRVAGIIADFECELLAEHAT